MTSTATTRGDPASDAAFWREYAPVLARYRERSMSAADWEQWYRRRLSVVLRHVYHRSPFYRRQLAGIDLDRVGPRDLARLPFTTKSDLRREMYQMLSGDLAQARVYYETNGTTGPPTPCPRAARDVAASNAAVEASWRELFRARFGDRTPVIGLMGPSELYAFGDVFSDVSAALGACHVKIWPQSPRVGFQKALRLIDELGLEVVVCAPALCLSLAQAARHYGYDPAALPIAMFLVLGEVCTPQFAANVGSVWPGATVYPVLYGSQEAMCIATGASTGQLYLSELNYLVELVDPETGTPLAGGDTGATTGEGELVLTMLVDGIKPLIRYRTGDLVRLSEAGPGPLPGRVVEVIGRVDDRIRLGGAHLHPAELEAAVLAGVHGCLGYQLVIDQDRAGADRLTVRMELLPGHRDELDRIAAGVRDRIRALTGVAARTILDTDLDPVTTTGSLVSWKAARIRDDRQVPDPATLAARQAAHQYAIPG